MTNPIKEGRRVAESEPDTVPYHELPPFERLEHRLRGVQALVNAHPEWNGAPISDATVDAALWLAWKLGEEGPIQTLSVRSDVDHSINLEWDLGRWNIIANAPGEWTFRYHFTPPGEADGP
jgi:hypothetical protein